MGMAGWEAVGANTQADASTSTCSCAGRALSWLAPACKGPLQLCSLARPFLRCLCYKRQ